MLEAPLYHFEIPSLGVCVKVTYSNILALEVLDGGLWACVDGEGEAHDYRNFREQHVFN
jgi:hypothetical protein